MATDNLVSYLNDHLAGSVSALELLDRLIDNYEGKPLERFFKNLRADIQEDQKKLEDLIHTVGEEESAVRKAGAWVTEKLSRAKIRLSESEEGDMGLFLALEALALGITGKRALWRALASASETVPSLARLDYAGLEARAVDQADRVEVQRIEAARTLFMTN
jgi:hypothetical protein